MATGNGNLKDGSKNRGPNYEKNKKKKENQVETLEIREAFEFYYGLGETRSVAAVAEFTKKSLITVKRWSSRFNWVDRVKERDSRIAVKLEKATDAKIVAGKAQYREAIGGLIAQALQDIAEGKLKIRSMKDLDMIIRLDLDISTQMTGGEDVDNMKNLADVIKSSYEQIQNSPTPESQIVN